MAVKSTTKARVELSLSTWTTGEGRLLSVRIDGELHSIVKVSLTHEEFGKLTAGMTICPDVLADITLLGSCLPTD